MTSSSNNSNNTYEEVNYVIGRKDEKFPDDFDEMLRYEMKEKEKLKRKLEAELGENSTNLQTYAWFHGHIPREEAEQLLIHDGCFLIRSSVTSPGEYVLSSRHEGKHLHFKIARFSERKSSTYSTVKYRIEGDEDFDSISALVMYHVGREIPITATSGAIIKFPTNRKLPLSFSEHKYASLKRKQLRHQPSLRHQPASAGQLKLVHSNSISSVTSLSSYASSSSPEYCEQRILRHKTTSTSQKQPAGHALMMTSSPFAPHQSPFTSPSMTSQTEVIDAIVTSQTPPVGSLPVKRVPPKPSRVPSVRQGPLPPAPSGSRGAPFLAPKQQLKIRSQQASLKGATPTPPQSAALRASKKTKRISQFDPLYFKSQILEQENKPMDEVALTKTIKILLETDPFKLARHLTVMDCKICKVMEDGLEDIFLQKGQQLRKDLLERYQSTAFWVVTCIVRGGTSLSQRIQILNVFIQVANELVHSLGNLFGFSAVMHGLTSPHLNGMDYLWRLLKKNYTNNAVTMEKKLRPLLQLLDEGKGQIAYKSTTIPHISPFLRYYENPLPHIPHRMTSSSITHATSSEVIDAMTSSKDDSSEEFVWFENLPNDGFDGLLSNMTTASNIVKSIDIIRDNFVQKLKDFEVANDEHVMEIFETNFHLRLLYGSKSFQLPRLERYKKIDKILSVLTQRLNTNYVATTSP